MMIIATRRRAGQETITRTRRAILNTNNHTATHLFPLGLASLYHLVLVFLSFFFIYETLPHTPTHLQQPIAIVFVCE